ncbi:MAG: helix-turn-helix domain-containing protein [Patescibacteria group bacterium]|nr:helix-turn-helix domain-containing protein [Patescibacteria group bacterium]
MHTLVLEAKYPISFRKEDAKKLGEYLKNRNSVVLIGMKRVGINNFLRFFLNHKSIKSKLIEDQNKHLFITVDLNDLIERELYPFWILTLKRISDSIENSDLNEKIKEEIEDLFTNSIQSQDLFLTIDNVRKALVTLTKNGVLPTIFFVRFDRLKDVITYEFFANLQGLKDATSKKLAYVFTSVRSLDELVPSVFKKTALSLFAQNLYIKPANTDDTRIIAKTYKERYGLKLNQNVESFLFEIVDGYNQYLQLALITLNEKNEKYFKSKTELFSCLSKDERILLQSEELWESLRDSEKRVLLKILGREKISEIDKKESSYLWDTGFLKGEFRNQKLFSPLFENYIKENHKKKEEGNVVEFTKKENSLFRLLKDSINEICEREKIIEGVWPEVEELGVSDWAIDRLVARVRSKLKTKNSKYEIQTVKTRGYKLISS